jgi:transcriptional regulator GlxA family with amidase domain
MKRNSIENPQTVNRGLPGSLARRRARPGNEGAALPDDNGAERARKIEGTIAYMMSHLDQPLDVATLAALANISTSHFFALFKRQTGCAPMGYFTRLRMQHACRLLDGTSASVKEVAAALGYEDPFYFSRVFKLINHVPPSRYRARQKPSPDPGYNRTAPARARK